MLKLLLSLILIFGLPVHAFADGSSAGVFNIMAGFQGTQIEADTGNGTEAAVTVIYTVPAGKTFFLSSYNISSDQASQTESCLYVETSGGVFVSTIGCAANAGSGGSAVALGLPSAYQIPTGDKIVFAGPSLAATPTGSATIHGWTQ